MPSFKRKNISINEIKELPTLEGDLYTENMYEKLFKAGSSINDKILAELKTRHEKYYLIIELENDQPDLVDENFYNESMDFLADFFEELKNTEKISADAYQFIKNQTNLLRNDMVLKMMEPYKLNLFDLQDQPEKWVMNHLLNTVIIITYYTIFNDLKDAEAKELIEAAWFHDIGHAFTDPKILFADHRLSEEDLLGATAHPHKAYELLKAIDVPDAVRQGVLFHHENFDENGFPTTLPFARLPLPPKIISIASIFENLFSAKPYRPGLGLNAAFSILFQYVNTRLDYDLTARFVRPLIKGFYNEGYYYIPGQFAVTNFSEICVIRNYTRDILKPVIEVFTDSNHKIRPKPLGINLTNDYNRTLGKIYSIEESEVIRKKLNVDY